MTDRLLAVVEASPAAVAAHDKPAWLGLFAANGEVHDPVGTPPHRKGAADRGGNDELGRFWDTFIAPNQVRFEVLQDVVSGDEVVREVVIHTTLANGLRVAVPTHLVYRVTDDGDGPHIARLSAYWEANGVTRAVLGRGLRGVGALATSSWRMLAVQGPRRTGGYLRGIGAGIGARGGHGAGLLATAINDADATALIGLFVDDAAPVALPVGAPCPVDAFLRGPGAGVGVQLGRAITCAWTTSCPVEVVQGTEVRRGLVFLDFDPDTARIAQARFYLRSA